MIRRMGPEDIPAAMRLKEAAGWNQTEQDWSNIMALEPEGCWVYEHEGQVAASTTVICYGRDLAWVGMVLVLPSFRGRGYARLLMEHALRFLERRRITAVRLDATEMGRPLYAKLGFREESVIERWSAPLVGVSPPEPRFPVEPLRSLAPIAALDRKAFGAGRGAVLERLRACFPRDCIHAPGGYAMRRPGSGAHFLGPCVAESPVIARGLIETLLARQAGQPVFWDLLPENPESLRLAAALGFERKRRLVRMVLGEEERVASSRGLAALQFAAAGFEYG